MTIIFGRYKIGEIIGSGSFGNVYIGTSIKSNTTVAIKEDNINQNIKDTTFTHEAKLLNYLRGPLFIPVLRYYGTSTINNKSYLVMDMLGKSLEDLKCDIHIMNHINIMNIGSQCIKILKYIHDKKIIHRDIKPENFLFSVNFNDNQFTNNTVNIIDFGLAKKYVDSNGTHIRIKNNKPIIGTMRYISINVHYGVEYSRRDDIISLAYMLIYLAKKKLPWQGVIANDDIEPNTIISRIKMDTTTTQLCLGLPDCFFSILSYAKKLEFSERPDYEYMDNLFTS